MKIQFLNGGLANQAFQYIFARYYELSHPGDVMYMDDSYFALHTVHNGYELEKVFGIKPHMLSECFEADVWAYMLAEKEKNHKSIPQIMMENGIGISMIAEKGDSQKYFNPFDGKIETIPNNLYCPEIMDYPGDVYYHGYWINKQWFEHYREKFLEEFCFRDTDDPAAAETAEKIREGNSVSIHIRRGDYVTLGLSYEAENYRASVKKFAETVPGAWDLFVFSDDIPWCMDNQKELGFQVFHGVNFVQGNMNGRNYLDMWLMSQCKGMILSNSSFCFLAALLNRNLQYCLNPTVRKI